MVWSLGPKPEGYFVAGAIDEPGGVNDYVGETLAPSGYEAGAAPFQNHQPAHSFQWTVADLVQAVLDAGLQLRTLREYPYANGCKLFDGMRQIEGNRYTVPEGDPQMPLMVGLVAERTRTGEGSMS